MSLLDVSVGDRVRVKGEKAPKTVKRVRTGRYKAARWDRGRKIEAGERYRQVQVLSGAGMMLWVNCDNVIEVQRADGD